MITCFVPATRADARLLRLLASLTAYLPPTKRAAHLAPWCNEFAERIEAALPPLSATAQSPEES